MRKFSILLSILVLAAMVLAACGGEETATNLPSTEVPQITAEVTATATEAATEVPTDEATGTPGVPVTGELDPARLSNQLDFTVWSQDGEQIGEVDDMVLDLDNTRVAYVVVGTGGFLDLGEREILVPWDSLQLQTGTGDTTGGQQNAFILKDDLDMFRKAPDFDLTANLPQMGQPASDWDVDIRNYWEGGGTGTGQATEPAATSGAGTGTGQATATTAAGGTGLATATTGAGTGAALATATSGAGTGAGQATATADTGTGTREGTTALQGVVLASEILGSTVNLSAAGTGTGMGQATEPAATSGAGTGIGQATATAGTGGTGTGQATATAGTGGTGTGQATATAGTGTGAGQATATVATVGTETDQAPTTATVEDMIVDTDAGDILYVVLNVAFMDAERWIPVPLSMFQWDDSMQGFAFSGDATMLQGAPFFEDGQFPDTTAPDWNSEFDTFWQTSGAGGSGTDSGAGGAMATPTP
jgi:sporulation protein YlmC with PRC-barrel domain